MEIFGRLFVIIFVLQLIWGIVHPLINKDHELRGHYANFWVCISAYVAFAFIFFSVYMHTWGTGILATLYLAVLILGEFGLFGYILWITLIKGKTRPKQKSES